MTSGRLLAFFIALATVALIVVRHALAGSFRSRDGRVRGQSFASCFSSPQAAVENLADEIGRQDWDKAYSSLANKSEFSRNGFRPRPDRKLSQPSHLRNAGQLRRAAAACVRR